MSNEPATEPSSTVDAAVDGIAEPEEMGETGKSAAGAGGGDIGGESTRETSAVLAFTPWPVRVVARVKPADGGKVFGNHNGQSKADDTESVAAFVRKVVQRAPELSIGQIQRLCDLLPPVE